MTDVTPPDRACPAVTSTSEAGLVDWYHPVGEGDHRRLEAWCRTLGPVVIDSFPSADFGSDHPRDRLVAAVWNTNGGAGDLLGFLHDELGVTCAGSASTLGGGTAHFVFLVQEALRRSNTIPAVPESWATPPPVSEASREGERLDIVEVARRCGLALFYAPAARNGPERRDGLREDKGNAILSTRPLSELAVVELPYEAARRVVPVATVRTPSGEALRLASVHLITTPPPWRIFLTANSARIRQALALSEALGRMDGTAGVGSPSADADSDDVGDGGAAPAPRHVPTVVAGDMNTFSVRETAVRHLRSEFPDSPGFLPEPTRPPFPTDHLFFRRGDDPSAGVVGGSYRRVDDPYNSDHHPIVATVRLGR